MLAWAKSTGFLPERLEGVLPREFIWWPNSLELVRHALQILELKSDDVLLDIGSGDLRACIIALEGYDVNLCVAVEVNWKVLKEALKFLKTINYDKLNRILIICADFWRIGKRIAKIANKALFLAWRINPRMEAKLIKTLTHTKTIVHNFGNPENLKIIKPQQQKSPPFLGLL